MLWQNRGAAGSCGRAWIRRPGEGRECQGGGGSWPLHDSANTDITIVCCGKTGGQQVAAGELGDGVLARSGSGVSRLGASWYVDDIGL